MNKFTLVARLRAMTESNMASLSSTVDSGRKDRAKDIAHYFKKINRNSQGHAVLEWDAKNLGSNHMYKCYVSIEPHGSTLFQLANAATKIRTAMDLLKNADVRCFCTCPDFRYSGAEYNMKHKQDSLEVDHSDRESSDMVPSKRDPKGKHTLCKHLYSCFNGILTNAAKIMSQTRKTKFPPSQQQASTTIVGNGSHAAGNSSNGGTSVTMNSSSKPDTSTTGTITTLNGGKAIKEDPGEAKAITILGNSEPVSNVPEVHEALDALATTLNSGAEGTQDTEESGEITMLGTDAEQTEPGETDDEQVSMFNSADDTDDESSGEATMLNN